MTASFAAFLAETPSSVPHDTLSRCYPQTQVLGLFNNLEALIASTRMGGIDDTVGRDFKLRLLSRVFQRRPTVGPASAISGQQICRNLSHWFARGLR